jgi:hypothetical protein
VDRGVHPAKLKRFGRHKSFDLLGEYLEFGDLLKGHPLSRGCNRSLPQRRITRCFQQLLHQTQAFEPGGKLFRRDGRELILVWLGIGCGIGFDPRHQHSGVEPDLLRVEHLANLSDKHRQFVRELRMGRGGFGKIQELSRDEVLEGRPRSESL